MDSFVIVYRFKSAPAWEWTLKNPVLGPSEPGVEEDTRKFKLGTGFTAWDDLPYYVDEDAISEMIALAVFNTGGGSGADPRVGNLGALTTTDKTSVVAALNEINTPSIPFTTLYRNAKAG